MFTLEGLAVEFAEVLKHLRNRNLIELDLIYQSPTKMSDVLHLSVS